MFLLTFIPEGLEPKQIIIFLSDEKTLNNLKKLSKKTTEPKITYNPKDEIRKVKDKFKTKRIDFNDYLEYVKKGYITTKILTNKRYTFLN